MNTLLHDLTERVAADPIGEPSHPDVRVALSELRSAVDEAVDELIDALVGMGENREIDGAGESRGMPPVIDPVGSTGASVKPGYTRLVKTSSDDRVRRDSGASTSFD